MKGKAVDFAAVLEQTISKMRFGNQPSSLYEPIRYIMSLGGKRLRPMLTLMSYRLYADDYKKIVPYAVAVEAFHNFTLMHDDIMDNAPLRRGKPTVHSKWNTSTAILSGDVMLVKVYEIFSALEPALFKAVIKAFNQCATEVCEGQQWDMEFEHMNNVTEAQYLTMIRLKTAVLLGFSLELGGLLANAPGKDLITLRQAGTSFGVGFQLKDDLLDAYADPDKFGKQVGGDIIANKKTFLWIKALELASPAQKKKLIYWASLKQFDKKEKVDAIKKIYDDLDIPTLTQRKVNASFRKAFRLLESIPDSLAKTQFTTFASLLIDRQQ